LEENKIQYEEIYYKIERLRRLVLEYSTAEYHKKNQTILYIKRETIQCCCDEIKYEFRHREKNKKMEALIQDHSAPEKTEVSN